MLKIDNLSNEIDAAAVIGGSTNQENVMGVSMGGVGVLQGAGLLSASSVTFASTVSLPRRSCTCTSKAPSSRKRCTNLTRPLRSRSSARFTNMPISTPF